MKIDTKHKNQNRGIIRRKRINSMEKDTIHLLIKNVFKFMLLNKKLAYEKVHDSKINRIGILDHGNTGNYLIP
jgi:hypothetical protein